MTLETRYGVPTVAVHTDMFDRVVRSVAQVNGMPGLRQVFVPQPIMGKTPAQLRAYVDGRDPITGRAVMQEVVDGLTRPFTDDELGPLDFDRSTPRLVEPDTEDNLHRLFLHNRWTDMLPIVLPTQERVAAMLAHTRRRPDEIVGRMRSTHFREFWAYTVDTRRPRRSTTGADVRSARRRRPEGRTILTLFSCPSHLGERYRIQEVWS